MARIVDADNTWRSVTLTADEVWQVREGSVLLSTDATEAQREGFLLAHLEAMRFSNGRTVFYRLASGTSARIARDAV